MSIFEHIGEMSDIREQDAQLPVYVRNGYLLESLRTTRCNMPSERKEREEQLECGSDRDLIWQTKRGPVGLGREKAKG